MTVVSEGTLEEQVKMLAHYRLQNAAITDGLKAQDAEHAKGQALDKQLVKDGAVRIAELEASIAAIALARFAADPDKVKAIVPGVSIKEFTITEWPVAEAEAWAREKDVFIIPAAFDVAAFKKAAPTLGLPFVTERIQPKVQIATDLVKVLGL